MAPELGIWPQSWVCGPRVGYVAPEVGMWPQRWVCDPVVGLWPLKLVYGPRGGYVAPEVGLWPQRWVCGPRSGSVTPEVGLWSQRWVCGPRGGFVAPEVGLWPQRLARSSAHLFFHNSICFLLKSSISRTSFFLSPCTIQRRWYSYILQICVIQLLCLCICNYIIIFYEQLQLSVTGCP